MPSRVPSSTHTELAVSFHPSNYSVAEGNSATLIVVADKDVACPFTIDVMPIPVTASELRVG